MTRHYHSLLARCNSLLASFSELAYYIQMEHTELARLGGLARKKALTKQQRVEIARNAGLAGGRGRKKSPAPKNGKRSRKAAA